MLELNNSKEREETDWIRLFDLADERFEIVNFKQPMGSKLAFVEVKWGG